MDPEVTQLSMDLAAELAANHVEPPRVIDPRAATWRFSFVKQFSLSAAHARAALKDDSEETLALRLGAGAHAMLFEQPWALYTAKRDPRVKAWQEFQAVQRARDCKVILNDREHREAKCVVDAIRANETAMRLLFDGTTIEQTLYWNCLGVNMRSTPDARGKHLAELKTTVCAKPEKFLWHLIRFHYHAQVASYGQAIEDRFGSAPDETYMIAAEKTDPWPVTVFRLTDETIEQGRKLWRLWMEELVGCLESGYFPAYAEDVVPLDLAPHEPFEIEIDGKLVEVGG